MMPEPRIVFRSRARRVCNEHAMVLQSASIPHQMGRDRGDFVLIVRDTDEAEALAELAAYERENHDWHPAEVTPAIVSRGGGWAGVTVYVMVLCSVSMLTDSRAFDVDWRSVGKTAATLVKDGEWYRVITALTLHADYKHLAGNLTFGGIFGLFAGRMLGSGLAWATILASGAIGNAVNACIQPDHHSSLGASTAVFGCLGLLSAYAWRLRRSTAGNWRRLWVPIVGGCILLGFLGTGGERTDVMAHVTGFASGMVLGALFGSAGQRWIPGPLGQLGLGCAAVAAIVAAWILALRA